jgi:hypothetical protein
MKSLSEDQPTGRGGATTQTGKPPWGGKGGPGAERDQNSSRPDPKAPTRSRRRPASNLFSSPDRGPGDEKHAEPVRHRGPVSLRRPGRPAQSRGSGSTVKTRFTWSQPVPAQSSFGVVESAPQSFSSVAKRGSRPARSSSEISVRCRSVRSPSSSCEIPTARRRRRRFWANRSCGVNRSSFSADGYEIPPAHRPPTQTIVPQTKSRSYP